MREWEEGRREIWGRKENRDGKWKMRKEEGRGNRKQEEGRGRGKEARKQGM